MIPSDLAARLRLLTEASFYDTDPPVPSVNRAREIQAQLPELLPGQRFIATLQRPLPDGTFKAVVAGRELTLALSQSAKTGDTLELVVTHTTPRAVFAELAHATPTGAAAGQPTLSQTGRLISFLLTGQPASSAGQLASGQPLLNAPPSGSAAQVLAPALRQALTQSGLFYESHQQNWLAGKLNTAELLREPQGQFSPQAQIPTQAAPATSGQGMANTLANLIFGNPAAAAEEAELRHVATMREAATGSSTPANAAAASKAAVVADAAKQLAQDAETLGRQETTTGRQALIPERLLPVVHQQLESLASQTYVLQGQAWPGLNFQLEIEDHEQSGEGGQGEPQDWNTTLRVTLPRLGGIEARIQLSALGVALRLITDSADSAEAFQAARAELESALEAAAMPLTAFAVELRDERSES